MDEQEITWRIECERCAADYTLVKMGRGYNIVTVSSKKRADALSLEAEHFKQAFLESVEVSSILERTAVALSALPSMAARHRVLKELGLATESLATYRKRARNQTIGGWLQQYKALHTLPKIYEYVGEDRLRPIQVQEQFDALQEAAFDALECKGNVGPVSIMSALGGGRL